MTVLLTVLLTGESAYPRDRHRTRQPSPALSRLKNHPMKQTTPPHAPTTPNRRSSAPDHMPYGTGDSCKACKIRRINHERWLERNRERSESRKQAEAELVAAEIAAGAKAIDDCPDCDELGRVSVYDEDGNEVALRVCEHPKLSAIRDSGPAPQA